MSNIPVDFQSIDKNLQSQAIQKIHLEQQIWATHLAYDRFATIVDLAAQGFERLGKGVIAVTLLESEDDEDQIEVRYRYIPIGVFLESKEIEQESPSLLDWLLEYDPEHEVVVGVAKKTDPNDCISLSHSILVKNFPSLSFWTRLPFQSTREERVAVIKEMSQRQPKKSNKQNERDKELDLYDWLRIQGIDAEKQVKTSSRHRLDLWIPGKLMIELKAGKVSADDVCQAIDYYAAYDRSILLVGTGLTSGASRGMDGFNKALGEDAVQFVTWAAAKPYLKGLLLP